MNITVRAFIPLLTAAGGYAIGSYLGGRSAAIASAVAGALAGGLLNAGMVAQDTEEDARSSAGAKIPSSPLPAAILYGALGSRQSLDFPPAVTAAAQLGGFVPPMQSQQQTMGPVMSHGAPAPSSHPAPSGPVSVAAGPSVVAGPPAAAPAPAAPRSVPPAIARQMRRG